MGTYTSKYTGQQIDNLLGQVENGGTGGSNPTGTIISFMGLIAPNGYLICDGSELNIAEYGDLATHFETQFGTKNHFGGDGTTTFALPDLRNEFLRGYHGDASEQLSGEVGIHQDATLHVNLGASTSDSGIYSHKNGGTKNPDTKVTPYDTGHSINTPASWAANDGYKHYTSRPTNVAVLYCIKY